MVKISLCMIARDEEEYIENAISSVLPIVDEVIVVDTGSKDKTKEIAEKLGAEVYDFKWQDDFSKARNESIKHATGNWILVLDADETISEEDLEKLKKLTFFGDVMGYLFTQKTYTNNTKLKDYEQIDESTKYTKGFSGWVPAKIIRLFRKDKKIKFEGEVHETVLPSIWKLKGKVMETDIPLHHYSMMKEDKKHSKDELYLKLGKKKATTGDAKSFYELGKQFVEIENYEEAAKSFKDAIRAKPDYAEAFSDLGTTYMKMGMTYDAKASFMKAISLNSESYDNYNNLGVIYSSEGRNQDAILLFMKAIELKPDFAAAYKNLGLSLDTLDRKKEAGLCFEKAIELNPKYKEEIQID